MNKIVESDMKEIAENNVPWELLNNTTILITGATGMIPSYMMMFLIYLNEFYDNFHCKIIALIRSTEKAKKIYGKYIFRPYIQLMKQDVCAPLELEESVDYIIHAASPASPQLFSKYPVDTILPNVIGTNNLLNYTVGKCLKRFLFFSSGEVYGKLKPNSVIHEDSLGVIDWLDMRSSYAESKRLGETLCRAYFMQYDVPVITARIDHSYGPTVNWGGEDERVFSEFIKNIIEGEDIVMKSVGTAIRPFCYLTDAVTALYKIMLEGKAGETYNMSNDTCRISIKGLADILVNLFPEKALKVVFAQRDINDDYKESFVNESIVDNSKLRNLGWKPKVGIEEGFRRTVQSIIYEENQK